MQDYFYTLTDILMGQLRSHEIYTCNFHGETSDFVRFNRSAVRQAGTVQQFLLDIDLIEGQRHATGTLTLSGNLEGDKVGLTRMLQKLREQLPYLPEDPHLLYATDVHSSSSEAKKNLPERAEIMDTLLGIGKGRDLVGIYTSGGIYIGFANSFGQRNWFSNYSFNFDWSFYHQEDKAVKTTYTDLTWKPAEFQSKVTAAAAQLNILSRTPKTISPGRYRVYLAPAALSDIIGVLCYGGFGLKSHRTKLTSLLQMVESDKHLHPDITIRENTCEGLAPNFHEGGFIKPDQVTLIKEGLLHDNLVSPRSAKEYDVPTNGAANHEFPQSVDMAGGRLPSQEILQKLDTGIYINNTWYLNYSDRSMARITGMTRFATFWVENGVIQAPLSVMRFDESIYRMFGDHLLGLTAERDFLLDNGTYHCRSTSSSRMPGALVEDFTFTL